MTETLRSESVSTRIERIAELARKHPGRAFSSLHHVIDVEWLREAYRRTRKDAAVGVDGQTAAQYAEHLESNLESLNERFHKGLYRAPAVRRVHIPKGDGRTRPIGIPTFEDKVLQRAVSMLLEAVYEQDFHPGSYGFRPKRSAHDAIDALWKATMNVGGGFVLEVDIERFFDTLDHASLRNFLDERITDGVVRRAVGKWLNAGVLEGGAVTRSDDGTPQGGVISPLLANVYLHCVLDRWFETDVRPRLTGSATLIRYADDFVIVFSTRTDAERVMDVLPKRFGKYGLTLHPDKTRLVDFRRAATKRNDANDRDDDDDPGSFDFLGFTHFWGSARDGKPVVKRATSKTRFTRSLVRIRAWCRANRHAPVAEQAKALAQKLRGHYGYFGITGNIRALQRFRTEVARAWRVWLSRRSNRAIMTFARLALLLARNPLPLPRIARSSFAAR